MVQTTSWRNRFSVLASHITTMVVASIAPSMWSLPRNGLARPTMMGMLITNKSRDEEARNRYRQIASKPVAEREIYILDIIRNNWKNGQGI